MKDKVEWAIMREITVQFKLAYVSPLLEGELHKELGISGEGKLIKDLLQD